MLSNVLALQFLLHREKTVSPDTCAAGVAIERKDALALLMRFLCAAAAEAWTHVAFVSKHTHFKKKGWKRLWLRRATGTIEHVIGTATGVTRARNITRVTRKLGAQTQTMLP